MSLRVLVRSRRWAVVAKPARLACHRSAMVRDRHTLAAMARERFGRPIHLVHRLDRGASGCLVVAFDPETATALHAALVSPDAIKTYLALVRGWFRWDDPVRVDTEVRDDAGQPRPARSWVRCLGRSFEPRCSLLQVRPETGRYHQVRRHVRDLGHPILGDTSHGDHRENRIWRDTWGLERLALHCQALDLPLPDGDRLRVVCPVPDDLVEIWQRLPWWPDALAADPRLGWPPLPLDAGR